MNDLVERLRHFQKVFKGPDFAKAYHDMGGKIGEAADEIEKLRAALQEITDHFADVMDGPMIRGAGIEFRTGVEGIPTIARARALLKENGAMTEIDRLRAALRAALPELEENYRGLRDMQTDPARILKADAVVGTVRAALRVT